MLKRLHDRVQGRQEGFTLIELLVVILIIGILAAIAIPTFLSQTSKANASNVQSSLNSAQTAMETYYTNNGQTYPAAITAGSTPNPLTQIEGTLTSAWTADSMAMSLNGSTNQYVLIAQDPKSKPTTYYDLIYNHDTGAEVHLCESAATAPAFTATTGDSTRFNVAGCSATGTW